MKSVLLGELFDRRICSVAERANDGLDQTLVARDFRCTIVVAAASFVFVDQAILNSWFVRSPSAVAAVVIRR